MTEKILSNDRICSRHFVSGKPAELENETNPDWLPSLNLWYRKLSDSQAQAVEEKWCRRKETEKARDADSVMLLMKMHHFLQIKMLVVKLMKSVFKQTYHLTW